MSEVAKRRVYFTNEYERPLDDKRRLTIPAKWRFAGDDMDSAYLAIPNKNGSITVYPPEMAELLYEKVSKIPMSDQVKQKAISEMFRQSESFGCDKQGRVVLNEKLLGHAGIVKEALLVGSFATFQIWDSGRFEEWIRSGDSDNSVEILKELGI